MSFQEEFATVNLIRNSKAETRGVDAFALALIKAERQVRKLVTYLVYQSPSFSDSDIPDLRMVLSKNKKVYFRGLCIGFDLISPVSIKTMVGNGYDRLICSIDESIAHRNKIFHGQLTTKNLTREDLFAYVDEIQQWCQLLSEAAEREIGYNGFARNSFQKSSRGDISKTLRVTFNSIQDYKKFLKEQVQGLPQAIAVHNLECN